MKEKIQKLINLKQEGSYWDFKKTWYSHENKSDLLHDIICMANNLDNRDAYIIIGVDQENSFQLTDVKNDPNRKNTQKIVDFLKDKKFAGSIRPIVYVETVDFEDASIDVLIIENSNNTPYYLTESFQKNNAHNIYTRIMDTNTPVNMSADLNNVEYLWKKRFGINLTIQERLSLLLNDTENWEHDWGNKNYSYHRDFPEFRIQCVDELKDAWYPAATFYTHPNMSWQKLSIMYLGTIIYETELWCLDGCRKYLPKASTASVNGLGDFWYQYYNLDTIEGKLLTIFTSGTNDISSREPNNNQFLVFNNGTERREFEYYLIKHFNDFTDEYIQKKYDHQITYEYGVKECGSAFSVMQVAKAAELYSTWKHANIMIIVR